ncbi:sugar kinase [Streptomyces sp. NPDC006332]|uniref:sugar kinase n=1 Tax=Streptomyces sp. NPDC006332 TaxID=3155456 RepID=UPI0033B6F17B
MVIPPPSPREPTRSEPSADVVCIGETMAVLSPRDTRPLAHQRALALAVGGAESNVACALVALGHSAAWVGRVGDDPLGRRVLADLTTRGVDVSAVETDPLRPTGVYFKDTGPEGTGTYYYRRDSAAAAMDTGLTDLPLLRRARALHLSGITAALSDTCAELVTDLVIRRSVPGPAISFDVNHRPALWRHRPADAAPVLKELARGADLVFVGRDEAERLWGTRTAHDIRDLLGPGPALVVKDAGRGATAYGADGAETYVPTPAARVVEPVGAGDAFAAGYLAALLEGRTPANGLRLGHLVAAATLGTREDVPTDLARDTLDHHLALDNAAWSALRLS